jgi:TetR/AcrR family transcriptional regulator, fatty acid metabolism regulator protein
VNELTDRSIATAERRRQILDAAVRVFARKGFHTCRVGDVAEEAGISHGLLYHYFASKDDLLEAIFTETWGELLDSLTAIERSELPAREQLGQVAAVLLRAWRRQPDVVRVLVQEIGRSAELEMRLADLHAVEQAIERIVRRGQEAGEFRDDVDPRLASAIFYGGVEELLTAWVFGQLPDGDADVARAERTLLDIVCGGLAVGAAATA